MYSTVLVECTYIHEHVLGKGFIYDPVQLHDLLEFI